MRSDLVVRPTPDRGRDGTTRPCGLALRRRGGRHGAAPGPLLRWPATRARRVLGRVLSRARRRAPHCRSVQRTRFVGCSGRRVNSGWPAPSSWATSTSRETSSSCWRRCTRRRRTHPCRLQAALAGPPGRPPSRGHRQAAAAPRRKQRHGDVCVRRARRPGGATPLRRQQRLLCHGPRTGHDLFVRPVRNGDRDARGRARIEARSRLSQAGSAGARDSGSSTSVAGGAVSPCMRRADTAPGSSA